MGLLRLANMLPLLQLQLLPTTLLTMLPLPKPRLPSLLLSQLPRRESTPPLLPSQLKLFQSQSLKLQLLQSQLLPPMLLDSHSTTPTTTELTHTTTDMLDTHTTTDTLDTHTTTDMLATHTCIPFQQLPQPRLMSN